MPLLMSIVCISTTALTATYSAATSSNSMRARAGEVLYFAYGSNMFSEVLEGRRGVRPLAKSPAVCPGHRLAFTALGLPPFEPAFASLEPCSDPVEECHGVCYRLSALDWLRVCASEGVPLGYQVVEVPLTTYHPLEEGKGATEIKAFSLRFVQPQSMAFPLPQLEPPPSRRYLGLLLAGAKEAGLAEQWQRKLAQVRTVW